MEVDEDPERTAFYRLLEEDFGDFVRVHEERFGPSHDPFRPVVEDVVTAFLDCGIPRGRFARVQCTACRAKFLTAFSRRTCVYIASLTFTCSFVSIP